MDAKDKKELGSDVDLFGLDEFGQPAGLNPLWGAALGAGLSTVSAIGARKFLPAQSRYSEGIGFAVAAVASGAMIAFEGTRAAGWTGLVAAFLSSGLRQLETFLMQPAPVAGWGEVTIEPTDVLRGNLGIVDIQPTQALLGQADGMPRLVGASLRDASDHVQLVGGPALNQFAPHWGATHFNRT